MDGDSKAKAGNVHFGKRLAMTHHIPQMPGEFIVSNKRNGVAGLFLTNSV